MRIAIVGAGGVGGLLAGLLARSGVEVLVVARGAALKAIRSSGVAVDSPLGKFTVRPAAASDDPAALGAADAVLVAVKAWQVEGVAPGLAPLVAAGGFAVPLQNGVEAAGRLDAALGEERVVGGLTHMLAWTEGPGRVRHVGAVPRVTLGERGARAGRPSARLEALAGALRGAGVEVRIAEDVEAATWEKFLLIEPWGSVAAAARAPIGPLRSAAEARALLGTAMVEVVALARARGVSVAAGVKDSTLAWLDGLPPEATASMQRDIGAGRPSELLDQTGAVVRLARAAGVPVPVHEALLALLLPQERAARGETPAFART
ncbi:MAG TPA: 2-dehydropantoate 2-reductase [Anaeromyxobacteraceae bacterium]|nr:2-dehydropantoate 2-reductase [Anaeromyxobacteraceae bacterium]